MNMKKARIKENIKKLIEDNKIQYAKEILYSYKSIEPDDIEIYSMESVLFIMENEIDKAISILEEAVNINARNFDVFYNLGYCFELKNDIKNSIRNYRKAWFYLNDEIPEKDILLKIYSLEYKCSEYEETEKIYRYYNQVKQFVLKRFSGDKSIRYEDIVLENKIKLDRNLKVLFAPIEIANQMNTYSIGLNNRDVDSYTLNEYESYLNYKSDFFVDANNIGERELDKIALMIAEFDVFHLFFGESLLSGNNDIDVINELNKKIVMNYWGTDVRIKEIALKNNKYVKVKCGNEEGKKDRIKYLSERINTCIVADSELAQYIDKYYKNIEYVPAGILIKDDNELINEESQDNKSITIVHAPTSRFCKGSDFIISAINNLQKKYKINFILVENMKNEEAKKIYKKADIIIDQILGGTYGIFAIEAMNMGKPVITYIADAYKDGYPSEIPIISANPDDIEIVLENKIRNIDETKLLGKRGIDYVRKYHDTMKIAEKLIYIYKTL